MRPLAKSNCYSRVALCSKAAVAAKSGIEGDISDEFGDEFGDTEFVENKRPKTSGSKVHKHCSTQYRPYHTHY